MILTIHLIAALALVAATIVLVAKPWTLWAGPWRTYGLSSLWFGLHALANLDVFWAGLCISLGLLACARADHLSHQPERNTP